MPPHCDGSASQVILQNFAVRERDTGQCLDESPMTDHERGRAVIARGHVGAEDVRPLAGRFRRLDAARPPLRRQMRKIMLRKPAGQHLGRTADIACERRLLANLVHDFDRHSMDRQNRLRGLQRPGVGRDDDAGQRGICEPLRGCRRLLEPERRQFRIFDSRIDARGIEMQVEITLAMAQQKHDVSREPNG